MSNKHDWFPASQDLQASRNTYKRDMKYVQPNVPLSILVHTKLLHYLIHLFVELNNLSIT